MKKLFLLILMLNAYWSGAQNYQCLQAGVKRYFINGDGYLRGIRIDSVKTYADSVVYYPFHTPRGAYNWPIGAGSTLDSNAGSWLGKKVTRFNDGTFWFDNIWGDTVVIKSQANVGDSWIFCSDTTALYYRADLIGLDTMTVSGVLDSVKKILITANNASGIVITDPVDSFQVLLSKNHGFVQVFDLYTFPYHKPDSVYRTGLDYYLDLTISPYGYLPTVINSCFSVINLINPTQQQLFQRNLGDVYEYAVCDGYFDHYGGACDPVEYYYTDTITSINSTAGVIDYHYRGTKSTYVSPAVNGTTFPTGGPYMYTTSASGSDFTCDTTLLIDTLVMPEEFLQPAVYYYIENDSSFCTVGPLYRINQNSIRRASFLFPAIGEFLAPTVYKSPMGLLSALDAEESRNYLVYSKHLIYYDRNGYECGQYKLPDTITTTTSSGIFDIRQRHNVFQLFPNPATKELTVKTNTITPYKITIISPLGQTIKCFTTNQEKVAVDLSNIPAGVYNVNITDDTGATMNEQIIIVHE